MGVAPASTTRGVDVGGGVKVGSGSTVLAGNALASTNSGVPVGWMRVALGTMVMRGTGEAMGVEVARTTGSGLADGVAEGGLVGVDPGWEQAISVRKINSGHSNRFIVEFVFGFLPSYTTPRTSGPVSRILSPDARQGGGHLSRTTVARRLKRPTRRSTDTGRIPHGPQMRGPHFSPAWPCSRRGLPGRPGRPERRWALTPPFHHHLAEPGSLFLWPYPRVTPPGCYPAPCPVESGLSSPCAGAQGATARPARTYQPY